MKRREVKYSVLARAIREQIAAGTYKMGDRLPSENELSEEFNFSRQTVRQALGILEREGYLVRRRGSGTYVAKESPGLKKSRTIGVITTYITDYIFPVITRGIEEVLSYEGYRLTLGVTKNRVETEHQLLQSMLENGVDGLIVEGTKTALPNPNIALYRKLESMGIPCVFFNGYYRELPGCVYVVTNDRECGSQASSFLLAAGCRHLGGIFKSDDMQGHERYAGFAEGLMEAGREINDDSVFWYTTGDRDSLFEGDNSERVLRTLKHCDGVVCYNDQIAYRLIELFRQRGIRVPEDVCVISFDNSSISQYSPVKITSFNHPKEQMGQEAAQKIIHMIQGSRETPLVMPMALICKESVKERPHSSENDQEDDPSQTP